MKHTDLFNIKLNHIRVFLTAVEYGSFTVAAEKLHLTQPFVSKSIQYLEEELGLYLIIRGSKKFQVTPAGKRLYEEWKILMQSFEDSLTNANAIQTGMTDILKIGFGEMDPEENIIIQNLRKTKELLPGLEIYAESNDMTTSLKRLVKGEMDMIVISKHMLPMMADLDVEWKTLVPSYLSVYVHKSNPLFERSTLDFSDLKEEKFIVFSPKNDDSYIQLLRTLSGTAGFSPQISCYIQCERSFRVNLELGNGIALADSYTNLESEHIKCFPLKFRNDIIAVWRKQKCRSCMKTFLSLFDVEK